MKYLLLLPCTLLLLMSAGHPLMASDEVDPAAWSENVGWINLHTKAGDKVVVYEDHLEGYAWGENIGWIKLGSYNGGGAHTYANTSSTDWGVNQDGFGKLSGFAWGENVGWINFNSTYGQVVIDPVNRIFRGFAWGENIGWISFNNIHLVDFIATDFNWNIFLPAILNGKRYNWLKPVSGHLEQY